MKNSRVCIACKAEEFLSFSICSIESPGVMAIFFVGGEKVTVEINRFYYFKLEICVEQPLQIIVLTEPSHFNKNTKKTSLQSNRL
jgi:hypothetical protein